MSNKLKTLKCIELTSQRQADNGTVCFHDPIAHCDYLSYESGYIRRRYLKRSWYTGKPVEVIYQLNSKRLATEFDSDQTYTERMLIDNPQERLDRLAKSVVNYRKTIKSYKNN